MTYFNHLDKYAEQIALVDESGADQTYAAILADGDEIAAKIGRRCLVFLNCSNCFESVTAYLGCLRAGVVPVLLSTSLDPALLNDLLDNYRPTFVFGPEAMFRGRDFREVFRFREYLLAATGYEPDYGLHDDLALMLTTSGSTGSPKLVRQSYRNIQANTESIIEYLGISLEDRAITTLPMHYTYGLSILNSHLASGARVILTEASVTDRAFWKLLREEQATTFGGVPYIYEMLKKLRFETMETPSLRYLTQAGGRLDAVLLRELCDICEDKGLRFIVMYGQTEATARMSWLPWERAREKSESIGLAIPGGRFWLADEEIEPIKEPGMVGELVYDGPNVTLGYAESRHDLARGDERGGRLFTGDLAKCDEEGFYYIVGRKKRFLKLFGSRINLDELENLLNREGYLCACTGSDDQLVIFFEGLDEQRAQVELFLSERLKLNRGGFKVRLIQAIPRNEAGKMLYAALPL
ncbi:MAG: AMP-binding protein [Deltaproteobacteria bacterium]|jgi:acyl-CoA synthetase (AMP-forming)/AMP-acid ligase II|nr:AMP-binding protein [Deltaproteobacteria bacterium]